MTIYVPDISVIIPIYNVDVYLNKCLDSILSQTFSSIEVILINDGSTDNSYNICQKYSLMDKRIILINQKNEGLAVTRNIGLNIANGKYISFVDSDDYVEKDFLRILYQLIIKYDADISMCGYFYIDENGKEVRCNPYLDKTVILENSKLIENHLYDDEKNNRINVNVWNKLYKRELWKNIRFPNGKIYEDISTLYLILDTAKRLVISPYKKYYYNQRENSISNNINKGIFDLLEAHVKRYEFIKNKYPEYENLCKKKMIKGIMNMLYKIYKNNLDIMYYDKITNIQKLLKEINIYNCGLDKNEITLLDLFMNNPLKYKIAIKIY